jgi:hypothetical protein
MERQLTDGVFEPLQSAGEGSRLDYRKFTDISNSIVEKAISREEAGIGI